jgi:hypothetical protein
MFNSLPVVLSNFCVTNIGFETVQNQVEIPEYKDFRRIFISVLKQVDGILSRGLGGI